MFFQTGLRKVFLNIYTNFIITVSEMESTSISVNFFENLDTIVTQLSLSLKKIRYPETTAQR